MTVLSTLYFILTSFYFRKCHKKPLKVAIYFRRKGGLNALLTCSVRRKYQNWLIVIYRIFYILMGHLSSYLTFLFSNIQLQNIVLFRFRRIIYKSFKVDFIKSNPLTLYNKELQSYRLYRFCKYCILCLCPRIWYVEIMQCSA